MASIVVSGDTSGAITLSAPSVAGTNTITLPAATGTAMVSGNMPAFSAYQSSSQTLSSNTWTKIQFQTKNFDTANAFDATTNYRFTPQVAGYYQISGAVTNAVSTDYLQSAIYKNGTGYHLIAQIGSTAGATASGSALVYLNGSTDYVELYGNTSVGQALATGNYFTWFEGVLVRVA